MSTSTSSRPYSLSSCTGDSVSSVFPGQVDPSEPGDQWLGRLVKQATNGLPLEHPLRSVAKASSYYVDDAKLYHLYTNPSHLPVSTLYRHAASLLLPTPGPAPTPTARLSASPGGPGGSRPASPHPSGSAPVARDADRR